MSDLRNVLLGKELDEAEEKYKGSDDIFGQSALTSTSYNSATRGIMFASSHLRQFVLLKKGYAEPPKVFTKHENKTGAHSTGFKKVKREFQVIHKIEKYNNYVYALIIRYLDKGDYDIIVKTPVEDLTEIYGFEYDTTVMDSLEEGDLVEKGTILYKTSSYDEHMNYGYGANVTVAFSLIPDNTEDSVIASKSFKKKMSSDEVMTFRVSMNDNDIFINKYATDEYKCFPDIGENIVDKVICARRRIYNNQRLYDLKASNLKKINFDSDFLLYGDGKIVDINIYCNKTIDELPDTAYYRQIKYYLQKQNEFYEKIEEYTKDIIKNKLPHSKDLSFWYKKAKDFNDPNLKFKEDGRSAFSHMILEFCCLRDSILTVGQKITGRQGNKGVVSKIWEDDEMYYTKDGRRAELILCPTAPIRRMITMPLFEHAINQIIDKMKLEITKMDDYKEKEKLFFDVIGTLNKKECDSLKKFYKGFKSKGKQKFIDYICSGDIYIELPPMWEDYPIYEKILTLYEKYDWVGKEEVYIKRFGREIKVIRPMIIADVYMMRLKQTSEHGFSVRSTGSVDKKNVPAKSSDAKNGFDLFSNTPIRVGVMESINSIIATSPDIVAKLHRYYRSFSKLRQYIPKQQLKGKKHINISKDKKLQKLHEENISVEMLLMRLKSMGLALRYLDDKEYIDVEVGNIVSGYANNDNYFIGTESEMKEYNIRNEIKKELAEEYAIVGTKQDIQDAEDELYRKRMRDPEKLYIDIDSVEYD